MSPRPPTHRPDGEVWSPHPEPQDASQAPPVPTGPGMPPTASQVVPDAPASSQTPTDGLARAERAPEPRRRAPASAQSGSAPPEQLLWGRKLIVLLRNGDRLDPCRLVVADRYNFVFETVSELASPTTSMVPKHAIDRIDIGAAFAI
jgi:hypothetical protein